MKKFILITILLLNINLTLLYAYNPAGITKAIDAADPVSWSNIGAYIYDTFAYQHATKEFIEDNPLLAAIITDPESTPEAKQYAQQIQLNYIADQLGIEKENLYIYLSGLSDTGVAAESKGLFVKKTGDIYLNIGEIAENETLATTLGHEILHAIEQAKNKNYGEAYADLMGENLNNALNTELKIYGYIPVTYNVRTNEQWRELYNDDPLIINNNYTAGLFGYDEVEQKVLEYFDYRYWQAVRAGNIKEANRIKAEWDKTEQTILNNTQLTLDATGMLDPTPISDGTNAIISILRKNYIEAGLSAASIIPIAGDILGKGGKLGLKYGDEVSGVASKKAIWSTTKNKSSVENAYGHYKKHGQEFPQYQNVKQYIEGTHNFVNNPPSGTLIKTRANGDKIFYAPNSNTFAVQKSDGAPKTMFKPDPSKHGYPTNMDYYNAQ